MLSKDNTTKAFLELVKAGLWETDARLSQLNDIDYSRVLSIAEEQSVVGLVAAGLEHVTDISVPKPVVLQLVGQTLQLEQRNQAMNDFIGVIVDKMRGAGIYTLLVKGQGVAQCYERPLWRACGDADFFLSDENYKKAKAFLQPQASVVETEGEYQKHLSMTINSWVVELHGALRTQLSSRVDRMIDRTQNAVFYDGQVRSWMDGKTQVFLPDSNNDVIFIFTHFLKHFFKGGLGLRQICDWCRLLYRYRDSIDVRLLERRLREAGLMSEWEAFGYFAVEYLGIPASAMPLINENHNARLERKARRIKDFVLMSGNFGHNRDRSYFEKYPYVIRKFCSFGRRIKDMFNHARIFPLDSVRFLSSIVFHGIRDAVRGE